MKIMPKGFSRRRNRDISIIEPLESRIAPAVIIVNSLLDSAVSAKTDLRQALAQADADLVTHPGVVNTIVFHLPAAEAHTENIITLGGAALASNGDVNIVGPGAGKLIIDGGGASGVFDFSDPSATRDSPVSISGLSIIHGNADNGGGIYSHDSLALKSVVISGNSAAGTAGITVEGSTATGAKFSISNSLVTGNAGDGGGGIGLYGVKSFAAASTVITGNSATDENCGGLYAGISSTGTGGTITGCLISGNTAAGYSGGLELQNAGVSKITISGTIIAGNHAASTSGEGGGGIFIGGGATVITGSTIENNTAEYNGGGIDVESGAASLTITGSTISGNKTLSSNAGNQGGGGICLYGPEGTSALPVKIASSHINDNTAALDGGGIFAIHDIALSITGSTISGNHATGSDGFGGGGIATVGNGSTNQVNLSVTASTLSGNVTPASGGAICAYGAGGAGTGTITLISSRLTGNFAAVSGGGMQAGTFGHVTMKNDMVLSNFANGSGGGVAFQGGDGSRAPVAITGGLVSGNSAPHGGGLTFNYATATIQGVTITGNAASVDGGGVETVTTPGSSSTLIFKMDNLTGNSAPAGPDLDNTDGSTITFM